MPRRLQRSVSNDSDWENDESLSSKRSKSSSSPEPDEAYASLSVGSVVGVPVKLADGLIRMSLALVIEAPNAASPGTGLFLETNHDLRSEGCDDDRLTRRTGLWLSNTHVSLETAYRMTDGFDAMIVGLFWETDHGPESSRDVSEMTRQYRDYISSVRDVGLSSAVPESCRAILNAALHRGAAKTDAELLRLRNLLSRHAPRRLPYSADTVCVACGAQKRCSHILGDFPVGGDCARALLKAKEVCDLVAKLQRRKRLPYPHEFQRWLEDAGALGQ